jgi:DNA polymerase III delta subunit
METIIVHGEYTKDSENRIMQFREAAKARGWEVSSLDKNGRDLINLLTPSLFGQKRLLVIDDYRLIGKSEFSYLEKNKDKIEVTLVIFHKGIIPQSILKKFPNVKKIETYEPPKIIYKFLESVYPNNSQECLKLLHFLLEQDPVELVFYLLSMHFKDLYWVKCDPSTIPYVSWRVAKLESQAKKFSKLKLKKIISEMAKIDLEVKTSKKDLLYELDLMLVSQLE